MAGFDGVLLPNVDVLGNIQLVETGLQDWDCPVCLQLLKDPFLTECCGHHFCTKCIDSVRQQKNECPLCKDYPIKGIIDKRFKREINEAQVYCPLRSQGCEWIGKYGNLNTHLNIGKQSGQCKYVPVDCPNNCYLVFARRDIKRHANNECQYRSFTCPYCSHQDIFMFVEQHHYPKCPNYPVNCPNNCTKDKIKRGQLQKHLSVCPNVTVSCPFSKVGCKAKVKRCNLKKHNDSNFNQHQNLITTAITDLRRDSKTLKEDFQLNSQQLSVQLEATQTRISTLEEKCFQLEHDLHTITEEVETQNKQFIKELDLVSINYTEVQEMMSFMCEDNEQLRNHLAVLQSKYDSLESKVTDMNNRLTRTDQQSTVRNDAMKETLSEVTDKVTSLQCEVSSMSQKPLGVDYWIEGYKLMAQRMREMNWELYLKTMAEAVTQFPEPVCPVILQVNGYEQAKMQRDTLVTSSFYIKTAEGEYKFVLVINFTANSMVVSASITRGKHDNFLTWPFRGTIIVTLLNPVEDKNHYNKEIWSVADNPGFKYAGNPSDQCRNPSWSRQDFISYAELGGSSTAQGYLTNNSLYFEVNDTKEDSTSRNCCLS